jgi:hypothetical protein
MNGTVPQKVFNVPRIQNCERKCPSNILTAFLILSGIKLNDEENQSIARYMLNEKLEFD